MSDLPSFRLAPGRDVAFGTAAELAGIKWYEVFKCDSRYSTTLEPGSIRPQRLIKVKFVPPGSPQDDVRNFHGTPMNNPALEGQHSRWTIWITRKVNGAAVSVSYNTEVMDTTLHSEVVSAVEQHYYIITFGQIASDTTISIDTKS